MPVDVLTQHNNNRRTGTNLEETVLNVSNVNINQFGKIVSHPVHGHIYAQPLYVSSVQVGARVCNLVLIATMKNWMFYALGALALVIPSIAWAYQHCCPCPGCPCH